MSRRNYLSPQFLTKISDDGTLNIESLIILTCAIFIASIGLNVNSTAIIIGAMLISPLMGPLLAIGTGLALYNTNILRKGAISLLAEIIISLIASTIYFHFSPLTYASQEIIARTSPTIWDVMIAFFGGSAGIIGARKKGANNIVPGVAIATALMPPLCTVGYSIAAGNLKYFLGSSYLFLINCVFITLTAFLGVKIMKWLSHSAGQPGLSFFRKPTLKEVGIVMVVIILIIPSILSAGHMVNKTLVDQNVQNLVANELGDVNLIKENVDSQEKTINLTVSGNKISAKKIQAAKANLDEYNLKGYSLNIVQVAQVNPNAENQLDRQVNNIINQRQREQEQANEKRQQEQEKHNQEIQKLSPAISSVTTVSDNKNKQITLVELKKDISAKKKKALVKQIKKKYPNINLVEFVQESEKE
ncbi:DUF389 domain-containing protein [Lactobacillus amylovorus]|jgi:uncharacterized hydrophobic protein (TIGR00271 family)|uniref:DUF389 domain-containing protein n=3 Tax=Lactobacillus amylovorus TaxID=1604 RepID=F0TGC4_LACAM|nr:MULTISPECIES: DUF389 domain-containing protein [Lactobacillus]ADZ07768.1 hypothetical protein LAC30SC_08335 [Lactobacillus amylovorus]AEA32472.1 hypothetical protein LAB52_07765 [Lactobacillus amylovorus GRL1118]KRN91574.1 hypothetical protein IV44_GL000461 [Lactobacillus amylovorus DSM 16698]MDB6220670.1 DUF389 domain-containing protein [Lactobacillus amylovorus]MDB6224731.1 DUF389 domain-containing protein [Lactobacillus amylovorus]